MGASVQSGIQDISERLGTISVSSTMKVAAEADRLRREGVDVVDFGAGEPDFPTPDNIKKAAIDAIHGNFTKYTPAGGTQELKVAICERHKLDYGTSYTAPECVITVGGKHVIFGYMQVLINPGDEVIIPVPYWVTYKDVVNYAGGKCVFVETDEANGFTLTAEMIEKSITPKTKMVIINSPSNPSGAVLPREEFERIYAVTSKRNIWLMTDECYCRFLYDSEPFSIASLPGAKSTVIVAGSLSKTYAMTGWRIGFAGGPKPLIKAMVNMQGQATAGISTVGMAAAVAALNGPQDGARAQSEAYKRRRDIAVEMLNASPGISCHSPEGAFYVFPNVAGCLGKTTAGGRFLKTDEDVCLALLEEHYVATVHGAAYHMSPYLRISTATEDGELIEGLRRIQTFCEGLH